MRNVRLRNLTLVNFKGVRHLDVPFGDETVICGENGTGKTTIMDAFLWLLFGKDSTGRSDSNFNIKTLDESGSPILHLEHSVCGVLDVDGKEVKLQRCYCEKWVKPRGTTEETLQNHATEFYMNGVKLATKKEWDAEIAAILPEDVFRMVTNPFYFTGLHAQVQKDILMDMAGEVPDGEIAALDPAFVDLLEQAGGRPLAVYLREVAARKKAIKDGLMVIPSQIETAGRLMPEEEDWEELSKSLDGKRDEMVRLDNVISDMSRMAEDERRRLTELRQEYGEKQSEMQNMLFRKSDELNNKYNDAVMAKREAEYTMLSLQEDVLRKGKEIEEIGTRIEVADASLTNLRREFHSISGERLEYPEGAFVCPVCKRPLEMEDVEAKQGEMLANFNQSKSLRLQENKRRGMSKKEELEALNNDLRKAVNVQRLLNERLSDAKAKLDAVTRDMPKAVNHKEVEECLRGDDRYVSLENEMRELEKRMESMSMGSSDGCKDEVLRRKSVLGDEIQSLMSRLAKKEQRERAEREIAELEEKRLACNQALADLEKEEYVAHSFQKAKDDELLRRINGMFGMVSWSFVSSQLNGGEKLTCVCTVDGTPYPDVNNAGKINAGLDIINAICRSKGVTAPIFIDNRESVNRLIPTLGQVVNLRVSRDSRLVIEKDNMFVPLV